MAQRLHLSPDIVYSALRDRKRARSRLVIARLDVSGINERLHTATDYLLLNAKILNSNMWQLSELACIVLQFCFLIGFSVDQWHAI